MSSVEPREGVAGKMSLFDQSTKMSETSYDFSSPK